LISDFQDRELFEPVLHQVDGSIAKYQIKKVQFFLHFYKNLFDKLLLLLQLLQRLGLEALNDKLCTFLDFCSEPHKQAVEI
jgi:hypothetical protein